MDATEIADPAHRGLDTWDDARVLDTLWQSQVDGVAAVGDALPAIAAATTAMRERLGPQGRLVYAGAGTSGRIACQDAAELGPTFGWPMHRLVLLMAGGVTALMQSIEDAEDDEATALADVARHEVSAGDILVGVAASGRTRYTVACIRQARAAGAFTVGIANVADSPLLQTAHRPILLRTGPEVVAGSTRLAAGTAQKVALNTLSTLLMVRLGHVHDGRMVDMRLSNAKLRRRAAAMVADLAGVPDAAAEAALQAAHAIKPAVLVARGLSVEEARTLLARHGQVLRPALAELASR